MEIYNIVSQKLNNKAIGQKAIELAIAEVTQEVLNYCRIDTIPDELKFTLANMSVDLARFQYETARDVSDVDVLDIIDPSAIKTIKEGDTTITVSGSLSEASSERAKALKSHLPNLDEIMFNYKSQLQKFREMA